MLTVFDYSRDILSRLQHASDYWMKMTMLLYDPLPSLCFPLISPVHFPHRAIHEKEKEIGLLTCTARHVFSLLYSPSLQISHLFYVPSPFMIFLDQRGLTSIQAVQCFEFWNLPFQKVCANIRFVFKLPKVESTDRPVYLENA